MSKKEKTLYVTKRHNGFGKHNYYYNEYRDEGDEVVKYRIHTSKFFDGKENEWSTDESKVDAWKKDDANMPEWLKALLK